MSLTDETRPPALEANPLLADLTNPQREAVTHTDGPLLVLAAAGSGKTRAITRRIAYLVSLGIPPWSILGLTFTNKAAQEMRSRVEALLGTDTRASRGLTVTTFHSLGARLLRRYAPPGVRPDFSIYDTSDQAALLKRTLAELDLSTTNWPPRSVLAGISHAKNDLLDPDTFAARANDFYSKTIARIYRAYELALRAANAVDFDDLLVLTARMLRDSAQVRAECQARWRYLLIDEYQDTNRAQFVIASLLAGSESRVTPQDGGIVATPGGEGAPPPNICVVGDPDQSIYGWRGADISNILSFEEHYPSARVITLGENFRSTAPILAVADTLIRNNRRRKHKDLFTRRQGGDRVEVSLCRDEQHEARLIVDWLKHLHEGSPEPADQAVPWREMAVFYRTNALSRVVEDTLRASGVPYVVARGTAFYEREEVKNALAYLRVVANGADEVSLTRIVNTPTRGIGDASVAQAEAFARGHGGTLLEALRRSSQIPGLTARARNAMGAFVQMIDAWTGSGSFMGQGVGASLADLVERVISDSGLRAMYKAQAAASQLESDAERLDNLDEVVSSAHQFELEYDPAADPALDLDTGAPPAPPPLLSLLRAYLEAVSLIADADAVDPSQGAVTLMTLHAAKGLEFRAVAMIGLEDGLLPHARARESDSELEEERRLCFVGITRAMRRLHITSALRRTIRGIPERTIPSRFLGELGKVHTIVSDQSEPDFTMDAHEESGHLGPRAPRGPAGEGPARRFPVGSVVRHPQFGIGQIISVTAGVSARAQIRFRDTGTKTLVLEYARLERVE